MAKIELSAQDSRLLQILQSDARVSNQDLADQAGMSASACWRRVRTLEEVGVVAGYMAIVDAERAGFGFSAIVHVALLRHEADHVSNFIARVAQQPEVVECFATTGEADYHLRVVCRDKDDYNVFLEQFLFRLPGIAHVRTNLVLKEIKLHGKIPA
ncbi:Lrp/AsnC family transcriptional regulator [Bosea psychrotolerans]|uniref:DNA-binding Lrp family transcriptional regulator n=1 Tax=Bosea psychrotolerans TaxID=1871628 RepID=A0A2S4MCY6_9HYPH|nr:Lrp/AsnC family transcriptional regulator [Bosea psychrotolerans]POR52495.1 DNA-binding Lrp family transcriptional regulator [Bosea psychrotolerans]